MARVRPAPHAVDELMRAGDGRGVRVRMTHPSVLAIVDAPAYASRW
jgi:hypothetical protein